MLVVSIIGILVSLPGAIWTVIQIVDRFRKGPDRAE